ncbi:cupin domain-containing protein [Falsiroseomonas oryziterrae]|uniref:cupin domain-containing protein n=1 Tax=Falsiroseomonas oryziterrae TaxID=2911368 RepID=UPI001F29DE5D|nr:cupin domain-containing protein [Roseomonas sp. NPKOSM-4]
MSAARLIPPLGRDFVPSAEAEVTQITEVEGRPLGSPVQLKTLAATERMVLVECTFAPGQASKPHMHPDHDSIVYVVKGKVKVTIDGREFIAGPGDAWTNHPGVIHHIEALEPTVSVEVKSPPIKAW